jgi:ATP-dependent protease ClpP protease subunit
MPLKSPFTIVAKASPGKADDAPKAAEVWIYGDIGESWYDDTIAAKDFVKNLAELDADEITARINSYGGSVTDGLAIYNALKRHKARVIVEIDGAAFSIASLIAMAGDEVRMAENALMMIHAPWSFAAGNAADMRETADVLDKYAEAMSSAYVTQTGKQQADILAMLQDGKDHWFTAAEALAEGFIDSVSDALPVAASLANSFDLTRYARFKPILKPAAAAAKQEALMPGTTIQEAAATANASEILAADRARRASIKAEFKPFASHAWAPALMAECEDSTDCTAQAAAQKILIKLAEDVHPVGATHIETVEDEGDKRIKAISASIIARAGLADKETRAVASASQFRGMKMLDIAKDSLTRAGIKFDRMDQMQIVGAAFTQSTSDFPVLLENTMHKVLQGAYAIQSDTWSRFCKRGSVSDFRDHNRYRTGSFGNLDALNELGEFVNKTIPDGEKGTIRAGTKGNVINLSRQAIVNDDLDAFVGLADSLGRAARRTIEADVYALLALNGGLGPVMADGHTLFKAEHNNLVTTAAITVAALDLDRVKMASQTDVGGNDFLDLRPSVLLVPLSMGGTARAIVGAEYDDDSGKNQRKPNVIRDLFDDIVDTPRMTGTRRYLFADPNQAPVIEVAFLDGNDTPYLESELGFSVDGTRWKVRLDYGVGAVDYRGAVTNAG